MKAKNILCYSFAGTVLLSTILQTLAFLINYDQGTNYFESHAVLPILSLSLALIAGAIGIASIFILKEESDLAQAKVKIPYASIIPAIGFLLAGLRLLLSAKSKFEIISSIILLIAALYCVCKAFWNKNNAVFYMGFAAVIGCILLTGRHYFDMTVEINAPIKISLQSALLFASIFFTQELRCSLNNSSPRFYRVIAAWTVAIGCYASVPAIVAYLTGIIDRSDYFSTAILVLSITVLAAIRLILPRSENTNQ